MIEMRKNREIRPLTPADMDDYITIYLNAYPAFKDIGEEGRKIYTQRNLQSLTEYDHVNFFGLFEDGTLIAIMKLIDFSINLFGKMQPATGLMSLAVHPLHKRKGAALDMVRFFEDYTRQSGGLVAMLLPFRMDFYRKMGYGFGAKMDEYRIPTRVLPSCSKEEQKNLVLLSSSDPSSLDRILECHTACARRNHGTLLKFEEEIRDMKADTVSRRIGYADRSAAAPSVSDAESASPSADGDGRLRGYVSFRFVSESDVNYTMNRMEVDELVYEDGQVLRSLLGALKMQADLAETVVIRTGEEDFYHILEDPQDVSGNYIPFGYLQTNISAIGNMYKVIDPAAFVSATSYRVFPPLQDAISVSFLAEDELNGETKTCTLAFRPDTVDPNSAGPAASNGAVNPNGTVAPDGMGAGQTCSRWSVVTADAADPITVRLKLSDLSSVLMGSLRLGALVRLGGASISDPSALPLLDHLLCVAQKPFTNTDY